MLHRAPTITIKPLECLRIFYSSLTEDGGTITLTSASCNVEKSLIVKAFRDSEKIDKINLKLFF